jgi:hypothetical protein
MLVCYALENCSHWFVLLFAVSCALGFTYGFLCAARAVSGKCPVVPPPFLRAVSSLIEDRIMCASGKLDAARAAGVTVNPAPEWLQRLSKINPPQSGADSGSDFPQPLFKPFR